MDEMDGWGLGNFGLGNELYYTYYISWIFEADGWARVRVSSFLFLFCFCFFCLLIVYIYSRLD